MVCICINWCRSYGANLHEQHHRSCEKYKTEKSPRLFYYEDGVDAFIPTSDGDIESISNLDFMADGESCLVEFKRIDMTDYDFENMPTID